MRTKRTRNILLVSNYPSDVGYAWWLMEHFWILLSEHFERMGGKAYLAYPEVNSVPQEIEDSRIEVVALSVPGCSTLERAALKDFIKKNNISDIYFTDRPWFSLSYLYLRAWGIKNIVIHDHTPGDRPSIGGVKGLVKAVRHRIPLVCANSQFCVSELMKKRSITNGRIPPSRCITVQNGIHPVPVLPDHGASSREALGIPDDTVVCITTGRAHPYKRFDFVIQAAALYSRQKSEQDVIFLLVGDGPALADLQSTVEQLNLTEVVRLLGFRPDARNLLSIADFAMHAALGEGFSLSIVEYMSAELPVLVPNIPSVKQAVDHELNGFVYEAYDPVDAAAFITKLASDTQLRRSMGRNARAKANSEYTLDACSMRFREACSAAF